MPDAQDPPRPPGDGAGRKVARGGAKRTPAELETIVLSILRASPRPLGAYVIARQSRSLGVPLAPNQVYRILDRLRGNVRRIETLNAYCEVAGDSGAIMSCRACGRTATLAIELDDRLSQVCGAIGFRPGRTIVEIVGLCAACARE